MRLMASCPLKGMIEQKEGPIHEANSNLLCSETKGVSIYPFNAPGKHFPNLDNHHVEVGRQVMDRYKSTTSVSRLIREGNSKQCCLG